MYNVYAYLFYYKHQAYTVGKMNPGAALIWISERVHIPYIYYGLSIVRSFKIVRTQSLSVHQYVFWLKIM